MLAVEMYESEMRTKAKTLARNTDVMKLKHYILHFDVTYFNILNSTSSTSKFNNRHLTCNSILYSKLKILRHIELCPSPSNQHFRLLMYSLRQVH